MIELVEEIPLEQLIAERSCGLGGSDAGAVLGFSRWATPLDVYLEKVEGAGREENEAMRWGKLLEDLVAREWSERTGHILEPSPTLWHPEHDCLLAHVDRLGELSRFGEPFVYEGKVTTSRLAGEWGASGQTFATAADAADQVPAIHVAQVAHYMAVSDLELAVIAVFIGGQELRWYWLRRDLGFEAVLIERLTAFWRDHVVPQVPPPPTTAGDLDRLYAAEASGEVARTADASCISAIARAHAAQAAIREAEDEKYRAQFTIKRYLGDATMLQTVDGDKLATWRREGGRTRRTFRLAKVSEGRP